MREERVTNVVFDAARGADQGAAGDEAARAAGHRRGDQERAVIDEFFICDPNVEIIDRFLEDPRPGQRDRVGEHDTGHTEREPSAIADDEGAQLSCAVVSTRRDPAKC